MQVAGNALARIRESPMRGEGIATIFEGMAGSLNYGAPTAHFALDFQHPDDVLSEGDLIPVITLSLRPATEKHALQHGTE